VSEKAIFYGYLRNDMPFFKAICQPLKFHNITELDFSSLCISSEGMKIVSESISSKTEKNALRSLHMNSCMLDDSSAMSFDMLFKNSPQIEFLSLESNLFCSKIAEVLAQQIPNLHLLKYLSLQ